MVKHVAKHHVNEKREVKNMKGKGEEVVQKEEDQGRVEIKDSNEVEGGIKVTENKEKWMIKKKTKVLFSVSPSFLNEFL